MITLVREKGSAAVGDAMQPKLLSPDTIKNKPQITKALRAEALARARTNATTSRRTWIDAFYSDDAQARIGAIVAKLEKR